MKSRNETCYPFSRPPTQVEIVQGEIVVRGRAIPKKLLMGGVCVSKVHLQSVNKQNKKKTFTD